MSGTAWVFVDDNPEEFLPVRQRRKYESIVEVPCDDGTFRGRVKMSAHDGAGTLRESPWYASKAVEDPCRT